MDQEIAAVDEEESLAIFCLDLDKFKEINDLFGHAAGDEVLQAVVSRVTSILGERQIMARLGGDEFAILVPGLTNPAAASRLAEKILETLRMASEAPETSSISTSIGIALCHNDGVDRQALLTHADTALYRAKAEGRNTYRFFEPGMARPIFFLRFKRCMHKSDAQGSLTKRRSNIYLTSSLESAAINASAVYGFATIESLA
jgi:diguanylate cyclase (GGDEF)-like protein